MKQRNLFEELKTGLQDIGDHQSGKVTLRTYSAKKPIPIKLTPGAIKAIRHRFKLSQAVFARILHVSKRTLEKWEQGLTKPSEQSAALLLLVKKEPLVLSKLASI